MLFSESFLFADNMLLVFGTWILPSFIRTFQAA